MSISGKAHPNFVIALYGRKSSEYLMNRLWISNVQEKSGERKVLRETSGATDPLLID